MSAGAEQEKGAGPERTRGAGSRRARGEGGSPTVSVIMPAYNVARYIGDALESVFAQTFKDFEVVVVNDGSPDTEELERVLADYRGRVVYLKQENRGVSAARNAGIRAARAPFVAHLDPDDLWEPDYLASQLAVFDQDPSIDVLYPDALIFGDSPEAGLRFMDWCRSEGEVTVESLFAERCHVMCSVTARREALLRELLGTAGEAPWVEPPFFCDYGTNITLGERVFFNFNCVVLDVAPVSVGSGVLFGPAVQVYAATHPLGAAGRRTGLEYGRPVEIGDDVWVGGGAVICPGVRVGARSVVGAGSVVTRDIPEGVFAAGNPCRVVREIGG